MIRDGVPRIILGAQMVLAGAFIGIFSDEIAEGNATYSNREFS